MPAERVSHAKSSIYSSPEKAKCGDSRRQGVGAGSGSRAAEQWGAGSREQRAERREQGAGRHTEREAAELTGSRAGKREKRDRQRDRVNNELSNPNAKPESKSKKAKTKCDGKRDSNWDSDWGMAMGKGGRVWGNRNGNGYGRPKLGVSGRKGHAITGMWLKTCVPKGHNVRCPRRDSPASPSLFAPS